MRNIDVEATYGVLMKNSIADYIKSGERVVTTNLVKTIRFVRSNVYVIDANPRMATVAVYLEYNIPSLLEYSQFIWNNWTKFENYESQLSQ